MLNADGSGVGRRNDFLLDTGSFTRYIAEVVQTGAANFTTLLNFDGINEGRRNREYPLYAHTTGDFTYGEGSTAAYTFALQHHTLERLDSLLVTFFDLIAYVYSISGFEFGKSTGSYKRVLNVFH